MNWLWEFLYKLFHPVLPAPALCLTHPEEPMRPEQTVDNVSITQVLQEWLDGWKVPAEYWGYWLHQINFKVYDSWPPEILNKWSNINSETPAFAFLVQSKRELNVLAKWLTPGVVGHEQSHNSYALLTPEERENFRIAYNAVKDDKLIQYLYSINPYGQTSIVEAHAEIYRYLAEKMPECLKIYYPKLY